MTTLSKLNVFLKQQDGSYYAQPAMSEVFIGAWDDHTEEYEYFPFHNFTQKLWASEEYLATHPPIRTLNDLEYHNFLALRSLDDSEHIVSHDSFIQKVSSLKSELRIVNIAGPRAINVAAEQGCGIISSARESIELLGVNVVPVLPELEGDTVEIYVKVSKRFLSWPMARFVVDWIFSCRDQMLEKLGMTPLKHTPLFTKT